MLDYELEVRRLLDIMPASGRMFTKLVSKPDQRLVIDAPFPLPWRIDRSVYINFDLWSRLSRPQRDLLMLRTVCWLAGVRWFQPNLSLGLAVAGVAGLGFEVLQQDAVGIAATTALGAIALTQIWRSNRSSRKDLDADEKALQIAQRRGYTETDAAGHLLSAIASVAQNEGRSLTFTELLRCQALRAIAGLSPVGIPESMRQQDF
ncbi:DUF3318 domain-containing protein [Myxacorys almedinensis]|uniref:DUF3318 domain-containing protein n=1 Tax=Myxacorys almedinensis A TaxID=2690445 RepID=A0A8J7Z8S9_9CYAN|nr:DUF3318 domain-containing protein [Myxacorys almedinensis]NDJ18508.1 DUF3318 domain-containing protein [Myxacorys almedinensis A]